MIYLVVSLVAMIAGLVLGVWYQAKRTAKLEMEREALRERAEVLQESAEHQAAVYAGHADSADRLGDFLRQIISDPKVAKTKLPLPK